MAWRKPETLVDIRGANQYLQLTTKEWVQLLFQNINIGQACILGAHDYLLANLWQYFL